MTFLLLILSSTAHSLESKQVSGIEVANLLSNPSINFAFQEYTQEVTSTSWIHIIETEGQLIYQFEGLRKNSEPGLRKARLSVIISTGPDQSGELTSIYTTKIESPYVPEISFE